MTSEISNNENRSVILIGNVSATDKNATVYAVYWSKNGVKIDIEAGGRIQLKKSGKNQSLTIHNVNHRDTGFYRLTAISSAGSNESEFHLGNILSFIKILSIFVICKSEIVKSNSEVHIMYYKWYFLNTKKWKNNIFTYISLIDVWDIVTTMVTLDYQCWSNGVSLTQ